MGLMRLCWSACPGNDRNTAELEDLRHLYAHNYAGEADDVLRPGFETPG
jgi:hypothetical protein